MKPTCGIDGTKHTLSDIRRIAGEPTLLANTGKFWPSPKGVKYLGDNKWMLPKGSKIYHIKDNEYKLKLLSETSPIYIWKLDIGNKA